MAEQKHARRCPFAELVPQEARDHAHAAREELRKGVEDLLPSGFVAHRRAARKEMLLAVRTVIDAALERLEAPGDA